MNARQLRRIPVAAQCVYLSTCHGVIEKIIECSESNHGKPQQIRDTEMFDACEFFKCGWELVCADRTSFIEGITQHEGQSPKYTHGAQRGDHWRNLAKHDQPTVHRPRKGPNPGPNQHGQRRAVAVVADIGVMGP